MTDGVPGQPGAPGAEQVGSDALRTLTVEVSAQVIDALKVLCEKRGITLDEGVRRSVALWKYLEDEQEDGGVLAIIERERTKERIRELTLI